MSDEEYWESVRVRTLRFLIEVVHLNGVDRARQLDQIGFDNFDEPKHFQAAIVRFAKEGKITVPATLNIDSWDGKPETAASYVKDIVKVYKIPAT